MMYNTLTALLKCSRFLYNMYSAWIRGMTLYKAVLALCGLIRYIVNKVTKYKDVHAKAQCKDASLEVDLHEQNDLGTE